MHIAIIPDGNRRWAKSRGLPSFMGHRSGAKTAEKILAAALTAKIPYLTLWLASVSNITKRDATEVRFLFKLFAAYFKKIAKAKLVHRHRVHIDVFGEWKKYCPAATQAAIQAALDATKNYHDFHLTFLLAYSGTEEMVRAVQGMVADVSSGRATPPLPETVTPAAIKQHLYTKDLPPVDLIIRTGREPHLSAGFMMWDAADAQLYFSPKMWPDFSPQDFTAALTTFAQTERRLGK